MLGAMLAILQRWGPNVTVVSMNKWLFQFLTAKLDGLEDNHCFAEFGFQVSSNSNMHSLHMLCVGEYTVIKLLRIKPLIEVKSEDRWWRIFPMSFVFFINIVLENMSYLAVYSSFISANNKILPSCNNR
ncbi:unnamed protein product, partial [Musa acuminata subsp. burmannicoides]